MRQFAGELRAGLDEAARTMAEARLAGEDYGAEAWRERLGFLRRVAGHYGLMPWPCPGPAARGEAGEDRGEAAAPVPRSAQMGRPAAGTAGRGACMAGAVPATRASSPAMDGELAPLAARDERAAGRR